MLAQAGAYPPADQKRLPLVLRNHGIFWAGGRIVNRIQTGTENAGDLKDIPYNQQQVLAGQAYVEYFIPQRLRYGRRTLPVVMIPGGGLTGVHFLTTPDGREGWAHHFIRRGYPVYVKPGELLPVVQSGRAEAADFKATLACSWREYVAAVESAGFDTDSAQWQLGVRVPTDLPDGLYHLRISHSLVYTAVDSKSSLKYRAWRFPLISAPMVR